jgi:hypothetical protein
MQRWRGLKSLLVDAVEHGSRAVERIQMETAKVPFDLLEAVPPIAVPVKVVHAIHDVSVAGVHGSIRLVARVVGHAADAVIDVIEARAAPPETGSGSARASGSEQSP